MVTRAKAVPSSIRATQMNMTCPHCHESMSPAAERCDEAQCPNCGSSFRVCDVAATTTSAQTTQLGRF